MSVETYTQADFRKKNKNIKPRSLVLGPEKGLEKGEMPFLEDFENSPPFVKKAVEYFPTLQDFGFTEDEIAKNSQKQHQLFKGGEISGLQRLKEYMFSEKSLFGQFDKTRNEISGPGISSNLSPWIANGSLSVRYVYLMAKVFED